MFCCRVIYIFNIRDSFEDGMFGDAGCTLSVSNKIVNIGGGDEGFTPNEE